MFRLKHWLWGLLAVGLPSWAVETVTIVGDEAYPPYSYVEDGHFKGIYVDFLRQVSELMPDYRLDLRPVPWKRGLIMVQTGEVLGIFPPYQFAERGYLAPYSVPLHTERIVVMCEQRVMTQRRQQFPKDFSNLVIGINRGFLLTDGFQQAVRRNKIKIDEAPNNEVNLRKLAAGRIDCYANDQLAVSYALQQLQADPHAEPRIKNLRLVEVKMLSERTAHIGFSAYANPNYKADFINQLNAAMVAAARQGKMNSLVESYLHR